MKRNGKNILLLVCLTLSVSASLTAQVNQMPIIGQALDNGNQIEWAFESTTEDINFFIVQRSEDGVHFMPLALIQKIDTKSYDFIDQQYNNQKWFYRVVIVHNDGVGDYSNAVYLNRNLIDNPNVKPPTDIVINDHIVQEIKGWLNDLEFPTVSKLGVAVREIK